MENMEIYSKVRVVPKNAQKTIVAGRLKGFTDINPMWRIQALTEAFGMAGLGWKYTITDKRIESGANGTMCAFVDIDLFVKVDGKWSDAIQGTGGSSFISVESGGKLYTSDECYKMALTDALSVACKALGVGADVYWAAGRTKYDMCSGAAQPIQKPVEYKCTDCGKPFTSYTDKSGVTWSAQQIYEASVVKNADHKARCSECYKKLHEGEIK